MYCNRAYSSPLPTRFSLNPNKEALFQPAIIFCPHALQISEESCSSKLPQLQTLPFQKPVSLAFQTSLSFTKPHSLSWSFSSGLPRLPCTNTLQTPSERNHQPSSTPLSDLIFQTPHKRSPVFSEMDTAFQRRQNECRSAGKPTASYGRQISSRTTG